MQKKPVSLTEKATVPRRGRHRPSTRNAPELVEKPSGTSKPSQQDSKIDAFSSNFGEVTANTKRVKRKKQYKIQIKKRKHYEQ